jgi:tRNA modification GTPase
VSTIVALATPLGRSGIGIVRLSGEDSLAIARKLVGDTKFLPVPRTALLRELRDERSEVIDRALVSYFKAPHSFTGEDVIEISCHGSPVLLRSVIDACLAGGARIAEPGEFSLRALANGRMDLTEAEAIRDLIDAQTMTAARQAVRQMQGEFSHQLQPIKDELLGAIVILESALEFVEDDLPEIQANNIGERLRRISRRLLDIASTYKAGHLIREGLRVAIVGRPNVGKSSLFNALLGSDRAIVTDIAGTTRDQLHERFTVENIPISLIDTAGLRQTTDTVESIGVERSRRTMADADLVVALLDASEAITDEDVDILNSIMDVEHTIAINKIDKVSVGQLEHFREALDRHMSRPHKAEPVEISATSGLGLDDLRRALINPFSEAENAVSGFLVTDARHHDLLLRATDAIVNADALLNDRASEEIVLVGLHDALRYLGQITGETTTEDMLSRIFSTFCIGK